MIATMFFIQLMTLLLEISRSNFLVIGVCLLIVFLLIGILFYKMSKDIDCRNDVPSNTNNIIEKANGSR